ncbi:MAG TPA: DUF3795 domain-containing protein [Ignavibacteriales bacterium]|nr:DUF3795 domain-containing protein [Ignavibacteriales bacterium]
MQLSDADLLIAPCGINCGVCRGHLRAKNKCQGCRASDTCKPKTRLTCQIKTCRVFTDGKTKYCFECEDFPCASLKQLDKRYRTKYGMSVIENLLTIKTSGIRKFLQEEKARWTCKECGGTVCVHTGACSICQMKASQILP